MKSLLLISILLLSGCTQYQYDVTYEKCNGQTGSTRYISNTFNSPSIQEGSDDFGYRINIPKLIAGKIINNVCDFSYTRSEIITK